MSKDALNMQGLRIWLFLAVVIAWPVSISAAGQPLVADVTAHRTENPVVMVGPNGLVASKVRIHSPGATFLKVHFGDFRLPTGVAVIVSANHGQESYRYSAERMDPLTFDPKVGDDGIQSFSAMSVSSDELSIRLVGDLAALDSRRHRLRVDYYLEGLPTGAQPLTHDGGGSQVDSACGTDERIDAVCWSGSQPDAYDRSRPVGKVLTTTGIVCTAWRVGPQNRIFTAEHCIASQADVSAAEVWFNYQAGQCGGQVSQAVTKVSGLTLLAVDETLDFALFSVSNFQDIAPFGYLGLDVRQGSKGEKIYIPQHGYGQPKQLALESDMNLSGLCEIDDENHNGYGLATDLGYFCDTVASSSGSPVIVAASGRVIALHHLGGCVNSGAKMSLIWPQVQQHFGGQVPAGDKEPTLFNAPPRASFSYACNELNCTFSGSGSFDPDGTIASYEWNFGDGRAAFGERTSHAYRAPGTYQVTLTVTDNRGRQATTSRKIAPSSSIKPPPVSPPPSPPPKTKTRG